MPTPIHPALLPAGLHDLLPMDAAREAWLVERLMAVLSEHGYERVKPPLIEFEDALLGGAGAALADQAFRLMDPLSHRMLAVRPDMTPQVARIAVWRLAHAARPLRLAYAGQVLRVKGAQLRPERQFGQVGAELIGSLRPEADAEVVLLAVEALRRLEVRQLSVDLCVPTLVPIVLETYGISGIPELHNALEHKDAAAVAALGGAGAELLGRLIALAGPAVPAMAELAALPLPARAEADRHRLIEVVRLVTAVAPDLALTIDPVERRGFEYQTGVSFTAFGRGVRGELGRGGRYRACANGLGGPGEPAAGVTLYTDTVLRAVPELAPVRRLFVPHGTAAARAHALREQGWKTVAGLEPVADTTAEARRMRCGFLLDDSGPVALTSAD